MNAVQDTSNIASVLGLDKTDTARTASASNAGTGSPQELQDRFLTLLVTQMKNQDPLNPLDNAQVTSQLAQLNTVTGISRLNETLESLAASIASQQSVQAANLVGQSVLVDGNALTLSGGNAVLGVDLTQAADSVTITIKDGSGRVVQSLDVGAQKPGTVMLQWDGTTDGGSKAADGAYTFSVAAKAGSTNVTATTLSYGRVNGVTPGSDGTSLNVGGIGNVPLGNVKQII